MVDYTGEFYLPSSDKKYPGRISGDDDTAVIILEIFGIEFTDEKKIEWPVDGPAQFHPIILGKVFLSKEITLYSCKRVHVNKISDNQFLIKYRIDIIFQDVLIENYEKLKFNTLTICLPNISSWFDGWKSLSRMDELIEGEKRLESIQINDGLTICFIDSLQKISGVLGRNYVVNYQKYVQFSYVAPKHFDQIINDITIFRKLLDFSNSEEVHFKLIEATINIASDLHVKTKENENQSFRIDNYSYIQKQDVFKDGKHQSFFLISRWKIEKVDLEKIIIKWFINSDYYHIYDFYLDSNNWFQSSNVTLSNVMFNNRFLNLIQALEDFDRKFYCELTVDQEDFKLKKNAVLTFLDGQKDLKQWANNQIKPRKNPSTNDRLVRILKNFSVVVDRIFENREIFSTFPGLAKSYRDSLSHGNISKTNQGNDLILLFYIAQFLLAIAILKSLKIGDEKIIQLLIWNDHYQESIYKIKNYSR